MRSTRDFYFYGAPDFYLISFNLIKMYTKKYYNDCIYIISNRKANIIIFSLAVSIQQICIYII